MLTEREQLLDRIWGTILDAWHDGDIEVARKREQLYAAVEAADEDIFGYVFLKAVSELT